MKKILNDPYKYVDEMLVGICAAHPEFYRQVGDHGRVIQHHAQIYPVVREAAR